MNKLLFSLQFLFLFPLCILADSTDTVKLKPVENACVIGEKTLEKKHDNKNWAIFGDFIEVNVRDVSNLINTVAMGQKDSIILFLNNFPLHDIHPQMIGIDSVNNSGTLVFQLNRKSIALAKMEPYFKNFTDSIHTRLSVGIKGKAPIKTNVNITLLYINKTFIFITFLSMIVVLGFMMFFSKKYHLLQIGDTEQSPYSLAQVQLWFWTILVSFSFIYLWIINGEMPIMPDSVLVLLGISIGTKGIAGYIDYSKKLTPDNQASSKGFLRDILSDDNGINIQRAQMVIWTLLLGYIYLHTFVVDLYIKDFDNNILTLMGISSGTYALLKTLETKGILPEVVKSNESENTKKTKAADMKTTLKKQPIPKTKI